MDRNLDAYVKVYENHISDELCDAAVLELNDPNIPWLQHGFYNPETDTSKPVMGDKELDVTIADIPAQQMLMDLVWDGLHKYILEDLQFSWFQHWQGFSQIRFNRYLEGRVMAPHCDHILQLFDGQRRGIPILTILGVLNDDYEGGEFVMFDDKVIPFKKGSLIIFPSNFLYPHTVRPVTKGVRYTFVSWAW